MSLKRYIGTMLFAVTLTMLTACSEVEVIDEVEANEASEENPVEVVDTSSKEEMVETETETDKTELVDLSTQLQIEADYAFEMQDVTGYVESNFQVVKTLVGMANENALITSSDKYLSKLDEVIDALEDNLKQVQSLTPPKDFELAHNIIINAIEEYISGSVSFKDSISVKDSELVDEASNHFATGKQLMYEAFVELSKIEQEALKEDY